MRTAIRPQPRPTPKQTAADPVAVWEGEGGNPGPNEEDRPPVKNPPTKRRTPLQKKAKR